MTAAHDFDLLDLDHLRAAGSLKWSKFDQTIGAFIAEMDFGTAPVITEALHAAVDAASFGYLPIRLNDDLAQACADWHRTRYDWDLPADRIHPIADVVAGLQLTIEHYSPPGSAVILPTPAYMPFLHVPAAAGRELITVPMLEDAGILRMDLAALDQAFRDGGGLLVLVNPHNPTGRVFDAEELLAISEVVAAHDGRVYADEIHAPLVYPGNAHRSYASLSETTAGHTVTATSASKAWNLPGLKCAQLIISNDRDATVWEGFGEMASHGASILGVIANTVAYRSGRPWLDGVIDYLDTNRRLLTELLAEHCPQIGYSAPAGTYIGWLDCRALDLDGQSPAEFFRDRAKVALTDGADCGTPGFVRFVFATPAPVLRQAVSQMGQALRQR